MASRRKVGTATAPTTIEASLAGAMTSLHWPNADSSAPAFKYLTPKLRLTAEDLSPALLTSKSYHLICSPVRCIGLVQGILARRKAQDESLPRPLFIWEPVPDLCVPSEQQNTYEALKHVDVISPNHAELASIFAVPAATATGEVHRANIEACSRKLLSSLSNSTRSHAVVVRSGKDGCYVVANSDPEKQTWLPAYHAESQGSVVDPTGGGNGFLGGFAVGLVRTGDAVQAAAWGSVSASLCIEQVGVPVLEADQSHGERWNGNLVEERLVEYKQRCGLAA